MHPMLSSAMADEIARERSLRREHPVSRPASRRRSRDLPMRRLGGLRLATPRLRRAS